MPKHTLVCIFIITLVGCAPVMYKRSVYGDGPVINGATMENEFDRGKARADENGKIQAEVDEIERTILKKENEIERLELLLKQKRKSLR